MNTIDDKFDAIKSLIEKYKIGALDGSFIHRLSNEIDSIIDEGINEYDFCSSCLMEISDDVKSIEFLGKKYHEYCFKSDKVMELTESDLGN